MAVVDVQTSSDFRDTMTFEGLMKRSYKIVHANHNRESRPPGIRMNDDKAR